MKNKFEIIGYHLDFYCGHKFMGSIKTEKPKDDLYGYYSRKKYVCDKDIKLGKKTIRKGVTYHTEVVPLMGKFQGTQEEKVNYMLNTKLSYGIQ